MSFGSHSAEPLKWESAVWKSSNSYPGVSYRVRRASLTGRAELTRRVRGLIEELGCRAAGDSAEDRLAAVQLELEADRIYMEWGVLEIGGLELDGAPATVTGCIAKGPELLCREMAAAVREELALTENERKN